MKKILVPMDFSGIAKNALEYAINVAKALGCNITLFHSVQPILLTNSMGGFMYPASDKLIKKMDVLIQEIKSYGIDANQVIKNGFLIDNIPSIVETEEIDLVITGTHGAKGLEAFFFGTNSEKMFKTVSCPVLIIPSNAKHHPIKEIMYASDFLSDDIEQIERICEFAKPFNAQIIVLHVNQDLNMSADADFAMNRFSEICNSTIGYYNMKYCVINNSNILQAIEYAIDLFGVDIVCMSTVEKNILRKQISKKHTTEMAFHTRIPFMSFRLAKGQKLIVEYSS